MLLFLVLNFILTINTIPTGFIMQASESFNQAAEISVIYFDEEKVIDNKMFQSNVNILIPIVIVNYGNIRSYNIVLTYQNENSYSTTITVLLNVKMLSKKKLTFNVGI